MASIFRDRLLAGKHAVITGGGSGICRTIAETFAGQGANTVVIGRRAAKLEETVDAIRRQGGGSLGVASDVRDYAAVESAYAQAVAAFGAVDIIVCGAAGNFPAPALGMSANGFKSVVDIDLLGTFNTCRAGYAHLRRPGASILCISATHAFIPIPLQAHVCAAKSGIDMLARTLAAEWGPAGVRVNCLTPGPVDETEGMRRLAPTEEARRRIMDSIPLRRFATKEEIAGVALFLCSDAAAYVTGAVWVCDGGSSSAGRILPLE